MTHPDNCGQTRTPAMTDQNNDQDSTPGGGLPPAPTRRGVYRTAQAAADHLMRITAALTGSPHATLPDTPHVLGELAAFAAAVTTFVGDYGRLIVAEHTPGWPQHDQRTVRPSYAGARHVSGLRMYRAADHVYSASLDLTAAADQLADAFAVAIGVDGPAITSPTSPGRRLRTSGLTGWNWVDPDPTPETRTSEPPTGGVG